MKIPNILIAAGLAAVAYHVYKAKQNAKAVSAVKAVQTNPAQASGLGDLGFCAPCVLLL